MEDQQQIDNMDLGLVKSNCETFLKMIKNSYIQQVKSKPSWKLDYNNLLHKFKKYSDSTNKKKLEKIKRKIAKLLDEIKENSPKKSNIKNGKGTNGKKKSVKFNEKVQMREIDNNIGKRSWNDAKQRKESLNRGKFTDQEVKILMQSLCSYVRQHDLGEEGLITLCSKSNEELPKELKGAWTKISECLQNRSVQSCHNFCRRKFNPNNYNGKWTEEEEQELLRLVGEMGHSWKEIAHIMNQNIEIDEEIGKKFGRTPENIKDKWKQLGGDNANYRKKGPWTLEEALELLKAVCISNQVQLTKKRKKILFKYVEDQSSKKYKKRYVIDGNDIKIYNHSVSYDEIIPLMVKKNRCKKYVPSLNISWTVIQEYLKSRSIDDIRNFWQLKMIPLLLPEIKKGEWSEDDDLELLNIIMEMDVSEENDIDFEDVSETNGRTDEENQCRWTILLKGLGGIQFGKRFNVSEIAAKMIGDIETRHERYVPFIGTNRNNRTGSNQYINIVEYYRQHYKH